MSFVIAALAVFAGVRAALHVAGGDVARHRVETAWIWYGAAALALALFWSASGARTATPTSRAARGRPAALVALAILLYWPAFTIGLLSDDFVLRAWAGRGELVPREWPAVRPLPLAIWMGAPLLAGSATDVTLHVLSVVLHGLNAWLVTRLALAIGAAAGSGVLAGLLFLVSPVAVEPVAWLSAMPDVMATTFVLGAIVTALTVPDSRRSVATIAAIVPAALLTKENALMTAPLMVLAAWMVSGPARRRVLTLAAMTAALSVAYVAWRMAMGRLDPIARPLDLYAAKNFLTGPFAVFGLPVHRDVLASARPLAVAWVTLLALALALAPFAWRRSPAMARRAVFSVAWVLAALAPTYGPFVVTDDLQATRYLYLSAAGWCIGLASAAELVPAGRAARAAALVVVLMIAAAGVSATRAHLRFWSDAARVRDDVLDSALQVSSSCPRVMVERIPDHVRGAYVFRNGLAEALAWQGRTLADAAEQTPGECRAAWK